MSTRALATDAARLPIVNDDDVVRDTIPTGFEEMGFKTALAETGSEALALIEAERKRRRGG